ncbi:MAG: hypothetical protein GXP13_06125 [Gammaproteobacteria bacterium]|nr:hypothetical protein [Gammaproteobacteria bacterium]
MHEEIEATVIVKSSYDEVSYKGDLPADIAEVGDYLPDLETIVKSARYFRDAGFYVMPKQNCIKIIGTISQFESMFDIFIPSIVDVASIANVRVPELLKGTLVRVIFRGLWAKAS